MPKLIPLSSKQIIKKLRKLGYVGPLPGGRHIHMLKGTHVIPLPMHGGKDIGVGLQSAIIRELCITRDEWIAL